jgi:hypothetical protein
MVGVVLSHWKDKRFHIISDGGYGGKEWLNYLPDHVDITTRISPNTALYEPAETPCVKKRGRPALRGAQLPSLLEQLRPNSPSTELRVHGCRGVFRSVQAIGVRKGAEHRRVKFLATQRQGSKDKRLYCTTDLTLQMQQLGTKSGERWTVEEMHRDSKTLLGAEQWQGWCENSVLRQVPCTLLLVGIITLWFGKTGHTHFLSKWEPWRKEKHHPSFADMLTTLRASLIQHRFSAWLSNSPALPLILQRILAAA